MHKTAYPCNGKRKISYTCVIEFAHSLLGNMLESSTPESVGLYFSKHEYSTSHLQPVCH